jgi:GNAT superfamily N-acetyltransferase
VGTVGTVTHPLHDLFLAAAEGRFPPADGGVTFVPGFDDGTSAVVSFTAHAVIATAHDPDDLADLGLDGYGGALAPRALLRLAAGRQIGLIDVTLCARGLGGGELPESRQWADHSRVAYARSLRSDVTVHGDERGFVTLASGLGGRREMSIETVPALHGSGTGRALIREARALVPVDEWVFAAVSPGNARSLRAFLAQDFVPIGSEVHLAAPESAGRSGGRAG